MARLDIVRQNKLEPIRMNKALIEINKIGLRVIYFSDKRIDFIFNHMKVSFYPYSGWHTGKSIKDGRGLDNLIKQLQ